MDIFVKTYYMITRTKWRMENVHINTVCSEFEK